MRIEKTGFYGWLAYTLEHHPRWVIAVTVLITLLLLLPIGFMAPKEKASDNPTGNSVVKLWDHIEDTFSEELLFIGFIVEAKDGDMLTRENLYELYQREQALRESELNEYLYKRYDESAGTAINGTFTLADAVSKVIDLSDESITDEDVKNAIDIILALPTAEGLIESLSSQRQQTENGWTSPVMIVYVYCDDEKILREYLSSGNDDPASVRTEKKVLARENFSRKMQDIMRDSAQVNETWGIAIDLNLEIEDEGAVSFMLLFVAMVLIAILLLVIFRSWMIMLVTTVGLTMLIVWLKGFANLIGLKSSVTLELIVPITIVVLGVDYAIQALFRYRQEKDKGLAPSQAIGSSTFRVGRALVLAMCTTIVAFASNASSGIESVNGFAIAASFAIFASFFILGLFVPTVIMKLQSRKKNVSVQHTSGRKYMSRGDWLSRHVLALSDRWYLTIPIVLVITAFAAWGWTQVETRFDAKDALKPDSDFVVSLDKWDEHGADIGGELALLYFEGDLTQNEALNSIKATIDEMDDNQYIGRNPTDGKPNVNVLLLNLLEVVVENDYAQKTVESASGITITDSNGNLIPDNPDQLKAVYDYVLEKGLPIDENTMRYTTRQISEAFVVVDNHASTYATTLSIGIPGTREQEVVRLSSMELNNDLDTSINGVESITRYGLTGSGNVRLVQFDAIADALSVSLIIAIVAVIALLLVVFRSLRYAMITIIPVILVACWLYGFMYLAGYYLNMLTATIAAISIGVGIDFSIHFTERFREELEVSGDKRTAIQITSQTTGLALFSAALTTAIGFAVIAFAPMPMFSTFGILTAIMIVLSLLMALFVLPSLLQVFAPNTGRKR